MSAYSFRRIAALLSALALVSLVFCAPALAQSGPSANQYPSGIGGCASTLGIDCAQSVVGGTSAAANNVGQGTEAVNKAMDGPEGSVAAASAGTPDGAAADRTAAEEPAADGGRGGTASITQLPETGGAPAAALGGGALLAALGLLLAFRASRG